MRSVDVGTDEDGHKQQYHHTHVDQRRIAHVEPAVEAKDGNDKEQCQAEPDDLLARGTTEIEDRGSVEIVTGSIDGHPASKDQDHIDDQRQPVKTTKEVHVLSVIIRGSISFSCNRYIAVSNCASCSLRQICAVLKSCRSGTSRSPMFR